MRLYFNPQCSKSRAARALLEDAGYRPEVVDYLAQPPDRIVLERLLDALDDGPATLLRDDGTPGSAGAVAADREAVLTLLIDDPARMQRPVLEHNGRAVIARPPERVFELLDPTADGGS